MEAHVTPAATYAKVLGVLLALTVITVLAAGFNFGSWNVVIALGIATIKASLVALFFMHLRHDKPIGAVIFVTGAATLGVFLMICMLDSDARTERALSVGPSPSAPERRSPESRRLP
jgi:cytochrome c oxidase subunit 4